MFNSLFRSIRSDLATYNGDWSAQGFWCMIVYRFGRWRYTIRQPWIRKPFSFLYKVAYKGVQILTGIELPCEVETGEHLRIDHFGGIVVSGYAVFGQKCVLRNGVTIGLKNAAKPEAPVIGDEVSFGAGSKVLGGIKIGDRVDIGANSVVLQDVPSDHIAVGIPARILPKKHLAKPFQTSR